MADRLGDELVSQLPSFLRDLLRITDQPDSPPEHVDVEALADEQQGLVEALVELGLDQDEAADAVVRDRVALALARHRRAQSSRYTLEEIAEKSGVPAALLRDVYSTFGLPPQDRYSRRELRNARVMREFLEHLPREALIRSARARGTALAAIIRSDFEIVREEVLLPMRRAGADDLTVAVALAETMQSLEGISHESLTSVYDLLLDHQLSTELAAMATRSENDDVECAVGFVDVEGYTALSARIDGHGLEHVIEAFERRVVEVTSADPDVSPVKYMGDAVMLVAPTAQKLACALHELTQPVDDLAEAPLTAGMAFGSVIVREGDFFGAPVNLAARLTDHARAWSVLAGEECEASLATSFALKTVRPIRLRGLGTHRPLAVLHPLEDVSEDQDGVEDETRVDLAE